MSKNPVSSDPISFWEKLSAMATLVQAIVVVISILYIKSQVSLQTSQLEQQTNLARAANIQTLAAAAMPLNMEEVKSSELMKLTLEGRQRFKPEVKISTEEIKKEQYKAFLSTWLIFSENIYYQNAQGLIDPQMYVAWDNGLKAFLEQYNVKNSWDEEMKNSYNEKFRNHIDELLAQIPGKNDKP
jgi:hypothetical protein